MTAVLVEVPPAMRLSAARPSTAEACVTELGGRRVARFRLSGGARRGALGPEEGAVVERAVVAALDLGLPIVGILDTSGADVTQGVASLAAWGRVARRFVEASGVVPIVLVVCGPCVSGPALLLGLADAVVMTAEAFAYVSGPAGVRSFTGMPVDHATLGGAAMHGRRSGVATLVAADEADALAAAGAILGYLPSNNHEEPPLVWEDDPPDRACDIAAAAVPAAAQASYDVRTVVADVADAGSFLELWSPYAPNLVTGLASIAGRPVGVVANQPCQRAGTLDIEASRKAARLVQWCDSFDVPIVTFVDTPGFEPGKDLEWRGMIRHGAELVAAYAEATAPRLAVILRKAYGGAYIVMDSKTLGNDLCVAWPGAEIAVLGAPAAVQILHGKELAATEAAAGAAGPDTAGPDTAGQRRAELEAAYRERYCTAATAAARGYVDEIIDPRDTRRVLAGALGALATKRARLPRRRHTNGPL